MISLPQPTAQSSPKTTLPGPTELRVRGYPPLPDPGRPAQSLVRPLELYPEGRALLRPTWLVGLLVGGRALFGGYRSFIFPAICPPSVLRGRFVTAQSHTEERLPGPASLKFGTGTSVGRSWPWRDSGLVSFPSAWGGEEVGEGLCCSDLRESLGTSTVMM